eukprot:712692_1
MNTINMDMDKEHRDKEMHLLTQGFLRRQHSAFALGEHEHDIVDLIRKMYGIFPHFHVRRNRNETGPKAFEYASLSDCYQTVEKFGRLKLKCITTLYGQNSQKIEMKSNVTLKHVDHFVCLGLLWFFGNTERDAINYDHPMMYGDNANNSMALFVNKAAHRVSLKWKKQFVGRYTTMPFQEGAVFTISIDVNKKEFQVLYQACEESERDVVYRQSSILYDFIIPAVSLKGLETVHVCNRKYVYNTP